MKRKIYLVITILIALFSIYYYWQNRYVKLYPVVAKDNPPAMIVFHNQLFKIAEHNEVPKDYYKNIKYILEHYHQDFIVKNSEIYVRYKLMNDMELVWNYTTKTSNSRYFKQLREMDSINSVKHKY